jgi:hypothetical protein
MPGQINGTTADRDDIAPNARHRHTSLRLCPGIRLRIKWARRLPLCLMLRRDGAFQEMLLNPSEAKMFVTSRRYIHGYQSRGRHESPSRSQRRWS